jgi:hypothetical protein
MLSQLKSPVLMVCCQTCNAIDELLAAEQHQICCSGLCSNQGVVPGSVMEQAASWQRTAQCFGRQAVEPRLSFVPSRHCIDTMRCQLASSKTIHLTCHRLAVLGSLLCGFFPMQTRPMSL